MGTLVPLLVCSHYMTLRAETFLLRVINIGYANVSYLECKQGIRKLNTFVDKQ